MNIFVMKKIPPLGGPLMGVNTKSRHSSSSRDLSSWRIDSHVRDWAKRVLICGILSAVFQLTPLAQAQNKIANVNQPISSPVFVNIYWDSAWDADNPGMKIGAIESITQAVIQSSYFTGLSEYGVKSASLAPGIFPAPNCASKAPNSVGFYDPFTISIAGFISCEYDNGPPLLRQDNVIYNIILPPSSTESDFWTQNTCAGPGSPYAWHYHGLQRNFFGGNPIFNIVQTNQQCGGNAALFESLFHEMVEATTDPYPFDVSIIPPRSTLLPTGPTLNRNALRQSPRPRRGNPFSVTHLVGICQSTDPR
jgi:hypothetical protein